MAGHYTLTWITLCSSHWRLLDVLFLALTIDYICFTKAFNIRALSRVIQAFHPFSKPFLKVRKESLKTVHRKTLSRYPCNKISLERRRHIADVYPILYTFLTILHKRKNFHILSLTAELDNLELLHEIFSYKYVNEYRRRYTKCIDYFFCTQTNIHQSMLLSLFFYLM